MPDPVTIPSFGFTRGVIVRFREGAKPFDNCRREPFSLLSPNMLVVRGLGERTAVINIEGDAGGTMCLREVATADVVQVLGNDCGESI